MQLVLASTSPYRRELLTRLRLPFETASPGVDEAERANETPLARAERLAGEKARAVAQRFPDALIIGSDQVAALDDQILDKPGNFENAFRQLTLMRGKRVAFYTAIALHSPRLARTSTRVVPYWVEFRDSTDRQIEAYLHAEQPYDCAASAKAEALGIVLIRRMEGDDPTALIGLPLIALTELLTQYGVAVV